MNYTFRAFLKVTYVYGDDEKYSHIDLHCGNLIYEMNKGLTPDQMDEFCKQLQTKSNAKRHAEHMRNLKESSKRFKT